MANKQIANPLALAVLAHLYEQSRHPYELAATLRQRRKESSIKLNYGSLYTVIAALERGGFIRAAQTLRDSNRPERTVYEITAAGEVFMLEWMRELVASPVKEYPRFEAALSLLPVLPPDEAVTLLEARLVHLQKTLDSFKAEERERRQMKLPRLFSIESEFYEEMTKAEFRFVTALLKDFKNDADGVVTIWKQVRESIIGSRKSAPTLKPKKKNQ